jgi:hypothetical protein
MAERLFPDRRQPLGADAASLLVLNVAGKRLAMIDLANAMPNARCEAAKAGP